MIKRLTITRLEIRHRMEGKYTLTLAAPKTWPEVESTLTLTAQDMIRFGLDPTEDLVGATVELALKAGPYSWESQAPDTVLINRLLRSSEAHPSYGMKPPTKFERHTCRLEAKTPVNGGTLVILPSTYYELNLLLTEGEHRRLLELPPDTALQVSLRQADRHFRDIVLTYRGTLDGPRVFPVDYAPRMTALARAMIAYFDGDVDVVGHYCGLDIREECQRQGDGRLGTWRWRREYFAVDPLSPEDWETPFADSVARIDAILKERYDHRLPMGDVHEFYDHLETSAWESKKVYPVEELEVGLQAKYVFKEHCHLPSVVIEARSTVGNRKACQAACERLSQEAATLFSVRFDHRSWDIEEHLEGEPQASDQSDTGVDHPTSASPGPAGT